VARILHQHLFSWDQVDRSSDLFRLQMVLDHLPDEEIVSALEDQRGNGRNTYPVRATWNALLAGIVFQHRSIESLLRELRRNGELRETCGFNPALGTAAVPPSWAMSRFVGNVIDNESRIHKMFDDMVKTLSTLLPDLGKHLAFDGKELPSYSTGQNSSNNGQTSDPDADWGKKTYRGADKNGKPWDKIKRWFGYQRRTAVERVNARLDQGYGFEDHTIRGLAKMQARVGLALAVMLAMAVGFISAGKPELARSLVLNVRKRSRAA